MKIWTWIKFVRNLLLLCMQNSKIQHPTDQTCAHKMHKGMQKIKLKLLFAILYFNEEKNSMQVYLKQM